MSRHIPVLELAAFLGCEALAMLQSFFDESGTHGDARVTCIAGYVGTKDQWADVEHQWLETLAPYKDLGVTHWHSSDRPGKPGVFLHVDTATKDQIQRALVKIIEGSQLQVIWNAIDTIDFNKLIASRSPERNLKPYDLCFYWIVRQLILWRIQNRFDTSIGMMFAVQPEFNERSSSHLNAWHSANMLTELDPLSFGYPKNHPALQTADMISNEIYRCWLKTIEENKAGFLTSDLLRALSRNSLEHGGFATDLTLEQARTVKVWEGPGFRTIR